MHVRCLHFSLVRVSKVLVRRFVPLRRKLDQVLVNPATYDYCAQQKTAVCAALPPETQAEIVVTLRVQLYL